MAVPTITLITPDSGKTVGGDYIKIEGTNFVLPDTPPSGYLGGDAQKTISVQFDGVESDYAHVISTTVAYAQVPEWEGDYNDATVLFPVDIRVANLDDNEDEIVGENATLIDGYTYSRETFTTDSYIMRVIKELVIKMRKHIVPNVFTTMSRYYDEDTSTFERFKSLAPCIHLYRGSFEPNRFKWIVRSDHEEDEDGSFIKKRKPEIVDVTFDVRVFAKDPWEIYGIKSAFIKNFAERTYIDVLNDSADESKGFKRYKLEIPWTNYPVVDTTPDADDLQVFDSQIKIIGVHLQDNVDRILHRTWAIDDEELEVEDN